MADEAPDSLSSSATIQIIDAIGEGEIEGLVYGQDSIYIDGIPMRDIAGTPDYKPFTWLEVKGTKDQGALPGLDGTQDEIQVGLKLTKSMGRVIRSIQDADADAVRVTVSVPALSKTTSKGKIEATSIDFSVGVRASGGVWQTAPMVTISGKTTSKYQRAVRVELKNLGPGPYEVYVERLSDDAGSALTVDSLYWDSYTVINTESLSYPYTALIGLKIDAKFFSSVPSRAYHVRGLKIKIPANYDPVTRRYATSGPGTTNGAWDGTFKVAYSNNPAWCYFDLVTNKRYGLGRRVTEFQIDKWTLYEIGKYCDEMVPRGKTSSGQPAAPNPSAGGLIGGSWLPIVNAYLTTSNSPVEPRFTLNCVINSRQDAFKVLSQLASVFRAMPYWGNSTITLTQDRPTEPSMVFTNANVVEGDFSYQGSSRSARNTVMMVAWNDPSEDFHQKWEYVEDREGIKRYGIRTTEQVAFGCTSRWQARRLGLWTLYSQRLEGDIVTFSAALDSAFVLPGQVIKIMDNTRAGAPWGGRLTAATTTTLSLDRTVHLVAGSYTLSTMDVDGNLVESPFTISTEGDVDQITLSTPLSKLPAPQAIWTIGSSQVSPMLARVVGIKRNSDGTFGITAVEYNGSKYDAVDFDAPLVEQDYSFLSYQGVPGITGLQAVESSYAATADTPTSVRLDVSWDASNDPMQRGYILSYQDPFGSKVTLPEQKSPSASLEGLEKGTYKVSVYAVNLFGMFGQASTITATVTGQAAVPQDTTPAPAATGFSVTPKFSAIELAWDKPSYTEGGGNGSTRIWYADYSGLGALPTVANALLLGVADGTVNKFTDNLRPNLQRHYWIEQVTRAGVPQSAKTGGTNGQYAKTTSFGTLALQASSPVFQVAKNGTASPSSVTLTAVAQNLSGNPTFTVLSGTATLSTSGSTATLTYDNMATDTVTIQVTKDGFSDTFTLAKVREGLDSFSVILSNEAHALPADASGNVTSYAGSGTDIRLYQGATELSYDGTGTANGTWKVTAAGTNVTPGAVSDQGTFARYADHSGVAAGVDASKVTYTITGKSSTGAAFTVTKVQSIGKAKAGAQGSAGATGPTGPAGPRGSVSLTKAVTATAWSDTTANNTISGAGYGSPVWGDVVTQYNSSASFSETRVWSGTAWTVLASYLHGNMFIDGTILAQKVDTRGLTIKDAAGNLLFGAGKALDYSLLSGVPVGKNLLANSEQTTCSWVRGWTPNGAKFDREPQLSSAIWADTYRLVGGSTQSIAFHQSTNNTTSSGDGESFRGRYVACDVYFGSNSWDPRSAGMVPVIPGQRIIASVYGVTHRCDISIRCAVVDKNGASLSIASNNYAFDTAPATDILGNFTRMSVAFDVPSGAAAAKLFVRKFDSNGTESWVWLAAPQIEVGSAGQTQPSPYQPGPALNSGLITPENASTYIAAAAIGAAQIGSLSVGLLSTAINGGASSGARVEIASNVVRVYDSSGVLRVKLGNLA